MKKSQCRTADKNHPRSRGCWPKRVRGSGTRRRRASERCILRNIQVTRCRHDADSAKYNIFVKNRHSAWIYSHRIRIHQVGLASEHSKAESSAERQRRRNLALKCKVVDESAAAIGVLNPI